MASVALELLGVAVSAGGPPSSSRLRTYLGRPVPARQALRDAVLPTMALSGLGVAQPILDLFGRNPEFFIASDLSSGEVIWFSLVVALVVPLAIASVEAGAFAVGRRVGRLVHLIVFSLLAVVLGLAFVRQVSLEADLAVWVSAAAIGALVVAASLRWPAATTLLRYLSVTPAVSLAVFLFGSDASRLLSASETESIADLKFAATPPIVIVVFDEFPLSSLLTPEGAINAERFPNFARFLDSGVWYRNASAVSHVTTESVPSLLTGRFPRKGQLPNSTDHPRSLFTLLGGSYAMQVVEPITDLCPAAVCGDVSASQPPVSEGRLQRAIEDAVVVFGHLVLPAGLRESLPSVDQSWDGFLDDAVVDAPVGDATSVIASAQPDADPMDKWRGLDPEGRTAAGQAQVLEAMIAAAIAAPPATLTFVHTVLPHIPWQLTPSGRQYEPVRTPGLRKGDRWSTDAAAVRLGLQRHLMQVAYIDGVLGRMIDGMTAAGTWDQAVVVLAADHGVAFVPGRSRRLPNADVLDEIYRVPLFIKLPSTPGGVSDENVMLIDVMPTIVDALGVQVDWIFDGRSLAVESAPPAEKSVLRSTGMVEIDPTIDGILALAARNAAILPRSDRLGLYAGGSHANLVGRPVAALPTRPGSGKFTLDQAQALAAVELDAPILPVFLWCSLQLPNPTSEVLVALNGTVAGAVDGLDNGPGPHRFQVLVPEHLLVQGVNTVELLIPRPGPAGEVFELLAPG